MPRALVYLCRPPPASPLCAASLSPSQSSAGFRNAEREGEREPERARAMSETVNRRLCRFPTVSLTDLIVFALINALLLLRLLRLLQSCSKFASYGCLGTRRARVSHTHSLSHTHTHTHSNSLRRLRFYSQFSNRVRIKFFE